MEEGIAVATEYDTTYSRIIDFQDPENIDIPPPPSLPPPPPLSLPSSVAVETEGKDDFVQNNPLALLNDEEPFDQPTSGVSNSPTIQPHVTKAVTTSTGHEILSPVIKEENSRDDRAKTEIGSERTLSTQFNGRYVGSVRLPEGDLVGEKCTATLTECIATVAKGSKKTNKVIREFKENQKIILKLEERELKLTTDEKNAQILSCHLLRKIRAWAVGKETDSHHFAYVIRSPDESAGYSYVCRVFKCSVKAREIATALRNICQQRAAMRADKNY